MFGWMPEKYLGLSGSEWIGQMIYAKGERRTKMNHMEFMGRTAAAGDLQFTLPENWGESQNEAGYNLPDPPPPPEPPLTVEEIAEITKAANYTAAVEERLIAIVGEGKDTALTSDDTPGEIDALLKELAKYDKIRKPLLKINPLSRTKAQGITLRAADKHWHLINNKIKKLRAEYAALLAEQNKNTDALEEEGMR